MSRIIPTRYKSMQSLLSSYPRVRPPLSERHEEVYVSEYKRSRSGGGGLPGLVARVESWMHKQILGSGQPDRILELGAGTLNHVPFECNAQEYDVVEPFRELWEGSPQLPRVRRIYGDISEIPDSSRYDRIVSVAVLEHLTDLPYVVAYCGTLLDDGGQLKAGVPSEGGFLWSLGWRATTGLSFWLRVRMSYEPYILHEHVNQVDEIVAVVNYFFADVEIRRFPLPGKHASLYTSLSASKPRIDVCAEFLNERRLVKVAGDGAI